MDDILSIALAALRAGRVVGMPTDTVYGVAADLRSETAVAGLYALKGRPQDSPIPVLVASTEQAMEVAELTQEAGRLAVAHWPGPLTLVLHRRPGSPRWVGDEEANTIGVRVPDHPVALDLLRRSGPLAVTSANRSGEPPVLDAEAARAVFADEVAVYLPGVAGGGVASTVLDLTGPGVILRPGPVSWPSVEQGR